MKTLQKSAIALMFAAVVFAPVANAHAATVDEMLAQIQTLMTQIQELQKQLGTVKAQVKTLIKENLQQGMTDADIAKVQELLATDPTIYPEGKKTGYFGPLTREALKRFQAKHELPVTGAIDPETRDLLEQYLHEGFGETIPPGLLRAPGIMKKVEDRFAGDCEKHGHGMGPLCKKLKAEHGDMNKDDGDDDDENDDGDNDNSDNHGSAPSTTAQTALTGAQTAIDAAQTAITAATGDTAAATALLNDAKAKLADAQTAFDAKKYTDAKTLAEKAKSLAEDAKAAL